MLDLLEEGGAIGDTRRLPSTGGGSFTTSVERIASSAEPPWSVIAKHLSADRPGWDRELDAYESEVLEFLPFPLRAPALLRSVRNDTRALMIFEDLGDSAPPSIRQLAAAAEALTSWAVADLTDRSWWTVDALTTEFTTLADHPARILDCGATPTNERLRVQLRALHRSAAEDLGVVERLPSGPAHLDAYSRNLVFTAESSTIGLVDWASVGRAPIPTDAATIFTLSLDYLDVDRGDIATFDDLVCEAMHRATVGHERRSADLIPAYRAICRLRHLAMMMNALPMVERCDPAVSAIVGRPLDHIVDQWLAVGEHLLSHR